MASILITGGTGLLGKKLTDVLVSKGDDVRHLSRSNTSDSGTPTFQWDIQNGSIDKKALEGVDTIIHLAGASVGEGRWTSSRKKEIINSRVKSADLIAKTIFDNDYPVKNFISASAIGIYGNREDEWLYESSALEDDWLSHVCQKWEQATDQFTEWGIRSVSARIGLVFSAEGGALAKIMGPAKRGVNPVLGSGNQWYSWIHIDDAVNAIAHLTKTESVTGPYNVVAPNPITQKTLSEHIDTILNKRTLKPPTPSFLLKIAMGKMSQLVLSSARVSSEKLIRTGFTFKHTDATEALKDLLG